MSDTTEFDWKKELLRYEPSPNSKVKTYVNTTCSNQIVLKKGQINNKSSLYLNHTKTPLDTGEKHYSLVIEGKDVVLKKGNDLYKMICDQRAFIQDTDTASLKNLIIACDILEIHNNLILPECNVSIFTRVLDTKNGIDLSTEPLKWHKDEHGNDNRKDATNETDAGNGATGRDAGHVHIFAHSLKGSGLSINANGGNGQDAGHGKNGKDGDFAPVFDSYYDSYVVKGDIWDTKIWYNVKFSPPATLIKSEWFELFKSNPKWKETGSGKKPTSGTDAKSSGKPGEPGNGGNFCTNLPTHLDDKQYIKCNLNEGKAGKKAIDVSGGKAGMPTHSAQYEIQAPMGTTLGASYFSGEIEIYPHAKNISETKTTDGKSYPAPSPQKQYGEKGTIIKVESSNAWLHPLQLKIILKYARVEYLSNKNEESVNELRSILGLYLDALNEKLPDINVWNEKTFQTWVTSQDTISALIAKMEGQKDYFGNPAGYMPFLSLSGSIVLYKSTMKSAIKSLALAKWLSFSGKKAKDTKDIIDTTYTNIIGESKLQASEMGKVLAKIKRVENEQAIIEAELKKLAEKLVPIEERLIKSASDDLNKIAKIKFGLKMGAALLQVIPYAQPALGVVGKMTSSISDNYGKEFKTVGYGVKDVLDKEDLSEVLKKTKESLSKAKKNTDLQKKASEVVMNQDDSLDDIYADIVLPGQRRYTEFNEKPKIEIPGEKEVKVEEKEQEEKISIWSQVSGNMGSVFSDVVAGCKALSVPEDEVSAAVEKLKSEDKEWNNVLAEIKKFNIQKASFFKEFIETLEKSLSLSNQMKQNSITALKLRDSTGKIATLANEDVLDFANDLEERTKDQLIYQLYLMTKAYETTAFEALEVDWQAENVFDEISKQINLQGDFSLLNLNAIVDAITPVFETNLNQIRDKILEHLKKQPKYTIGFITLHKDSSELKDLNTHKSITINPHDFNCILPNFHHMKLYDIKLDKIEFENVDHEDLLNSVLSIHLDSEGIVRVDDDFRIVRSVPRVHTWRPTGDGWKKDIVSKMATDLFNTTQEKSNVERYANPPAWSDFELSFSPSNEAIKKDATIKKIQLQFTYDALDVNPDLNQIVIDIRSVNAPGANITIRDLKSEDITFTGAFYNITTLKKVITIETEPIINDSKFKSWTITYSTGVNKNFNTSFELDLSKSKLIKIECEYEPILEEQGLGFAVQPRFEPQPLYTSPNTGVIFSFIEDENVIEYKEGDGIPEGWAMVSTESITGFIKTISHKNE